MVNEAAIALVKEGYDLRQQGNLEGAIALYRQASMMPNAPLAAHFNLGNALYAKGDWSGAKACYSAVLTHSPEMVAARLQAARCEYRLGQYREARASLMMVLKVEPENFTAWLDVGHVCRELGETKQMLASYQKATAVAPHRWEPLLALTQSLEAAGQIDAAAVTYHRAVAAVGRAQTQTDTIKNQVSDIHWQMAKSRLARGDAARALEAMRQTLMAMRVEYQGQDVDVNRLAEPQIDLGDILMRLGLSDEAHRAFERASAATSEATLVRLAQLSFQYNLWQEAQDVLKRNVSLHPNSALAHWNLAHAYVESWALEDALRSLEQAEAIAPQAGAKSMRASIAGRIGDADKALSLYQELAAENDLASGMASSAAMSSLYSDKLSAQEVADLHKRLFAKLGTEARSVTSFKNPLNENRRIKLGIISADFHHQHPVNIFMQPVLARLNSSQFETTIYFNGVSHDEQTAQARKRVTHWHDVSKLSDVQLARRIEDDGIDILLDLSGHTSMNRMQMLARRVAPVQVSYLGYPGSTGVPNIDWLVADSIVAPEGSESLYSERIWRLPNTVFCFSPEADYPFPAFDQSHAKRPMTFGSFNNVPKLTQHTLSLWAQVLHAVPDSRLLLKAPSFKDDGAVTAFKRRFEMLGIDEGRLEFRGPVGLADMMSEYVDVDIALDPVPYNGGTTTLQAMWMGVPVVVKAGNNFVSRMGASFMQAAGLSDWVARSDQEYVTIAAKMATDRQALFVLKQGMRAKQLTASAWDIDAYTQEFERALRGMWVDFCSNTKANL